MNLRSTASRVRRKQQDQQCPDTDRLLTLDGIFGDAISTADIPDPDIDRSHVVPVVSSLKAAARNRSKLPLPDNAGGVWHIDNGFGPSPIVEGVFYALMAVDRKSRYKTVYPLANVQTSVKYSQLGVVKKSSNKTFLILNLYTTFYIL